jgi:hypothetical protein
LFEDESDPFDGGLVIVALEGCDVPSNLFAQMSRRVCLIVPGDESTWSLVTEVDASELRLPAEMTCPPVELSLILEFAPTTIVPVRPVEKNE